VRIRCPYLRGGLLSVPSRGGDEELSGDYAAVRFNTPDCMSRAESYCTAVPTRRKLQRKGQTHGSPSKLVTAQNIHDKLWAPRHLSVEQRCDQPDAPPIGGPDLQARDERNLSAAMSCTRVRVDFLKNLLVRTTESRVLIREVPVRRTLSLTLSECAGGGPRVSPTDTAAGTRWQSEHR